MQLEEFRKKKAAERAKKAISTSQNYASDDNLHDKHHLETDQVRVTDSDGAGTSDGPDKAVVESSVVVNNNRNEAPKLAQQSQQGSLIDKHAKTTSFQNDLNSVSTDLTQTYSNSKETSGSTGSLGLSNTQETKDVNNDIVTYSSGQSRFPHGSMSNQFFGLFPQASQDYDSSARGSDGFSKVPTIVTLSPSHDSVSTSLHSKPSNGHSFQSSSEGNL